MNVFMIDGARKPPRIGSLAILSGSLLCVLAGAGPALSADLPYDYYSAPPPRYEYYRPSYDREPSRDCYRCSCCGERRYAPVAERPIIEHYVPERYVHEQHEAVERAPVAERHWVQRDYIERRYQGGSSSAHYSYPEQYRYSSYYPSRPRPPVPEDPYLRAAGDYPPPRYSGDYPPPRYSGDYPPAPVTYEWDAPRPRYVEVPRHYEFRPAYEHEPSPPRSAYDYETSPRPPATVPSGYYYHPGYAQ